MRSIRPAIPVALATAALVVALALPVSPAAAAPLAASAVEPTPPAATVFLTPLKAKTYNVSSYYGPRCMPMAGASTFHLGLDMAAPGGAPISAVAGGVVVATVDGTAARAGYIKVRHLVDGTTYTSIYYHIWKSTTHVVVGQIVTAGQRISEVGTSGVSGGNHLHLEIWEGAPGAAHSVDPARFMTAHGVDLYHGATAVTAAKTPATCTYYAAAPLNFRSGPSLASGVIRTLPARTAVIHVPGEESGGFVPVRVGGQSGWVSALYVSPTLPPVVVPRPAPAAVAAHPLKPPTYRTTSALNLRKSSSLTGARILVIPKGADVGAVKASKGVWRQVVYKGRTGWVHSAYLARR